MIRILNHVSSMIIADRHHLHELLTLLTTRGTHLCVQCLIRALAIGHPTTRPRPDRSLLHDVVRYGRVYVS
ncbi:hypothetical protein DTO021C3_9238 [Paecilomyces variotii]|nr:hypothetical protein DTO021C3_9238 [Paecilomyces variotii]